MPGGGTKETGLVGRVLSGAGQLLGYVPGMTSPWPSTLALWEGTLALDFTETVERGLSGKLWRCGNEKEMIEIKARSQVSEQNTLLTSHHKTLLHMNRKTERNPF